MINFDIIFSTKLNLNAFTQSQEDGQEGEDGGDDAGRRWDSYGRRYCRYLALYTLSKT